MKALKISLSMLFIFGLFLILGCQAQTEETPEQKLSDFKETPEPLPDIFSPFTWKMDLKKVAKLFPNKEILEEQYLAGVGEKEYRKVKAISISPLQWKYLDNSYARIQHVEYREITYIGIETEATGDTRPECSLKNTLLQNKPIPDWCLNDYNKGQVNIYEKLKKELKKTYGPPSTEIEKPQTKGEETTIKRAIWKRKGFVLYAGVYEDELGYWYVALAAERITDSH